MDGKLYRRDFIDSYGIRFNGTRANEDMDYNMLVSLLCDNPNEQIHSVSDVVCKVYRMPDSITHAGNGQFVWDQMFCGLVDNFIWALGEAKSYRSFSVAVIDKILLGLFICYTYWSAISVEKPAFAAQREKQHLKLSEGFMPPIDFREFLTRLKDDNYDPEQIRRIWAQMKHSPETRACVE